MICQKTSVFTALVLITCFHLSSLLHAQPKTNNSQAHLSKSVTSQTQQEVCDEPIQKLATQSQSTKAQPSACLGLGQVNQVKIVAAKELSNMNKNNHTIATKEDRRPTSTKGALNVLGQPLKLCCSDPLTGYERDGFCHTGAHDRGKHTVCAIMTDEFLEFTKKQGNDLSTPYPQYNFPGLKAGDRWCLCAVRWAEAEKAGYAPRVDLTATHQKTLDYVPLETLKKHSMTGKQ